MKQVLRSNDPVELSWARAVLEGQGIECLHFDQHTALMEGSIPVIEQRLMVVDEDYEQAVALLQRARAAL